MSTDQYISESLIHRFKSPVESIKLPQKFTFPFYYEPHTLSKLAAQELQKNLEQDSRWNTVCGLNESENTREIGRMFGVLIIQDRNGDLGYLTAISGNLIHDVDYSTFVPTIYDLNNPEGFFKKGEAEVNAMNREIANLEQNEQYSNALKCLESTKAKEAEAIALQKSLMKTNKKHRTTKREDVMKSGDQETIDRVKVELNLESQREKIVLKKIKEHWAKEVATANELYMSLHNDIVNKKKYRKTFSAKLQKALFNQYQFLNIDGKRKGLSSIFSEIGLETPPSGAGDCAAPRLLQYAFQHRLKPLAMAEFWWGASPQSAIRKHKQFYPSCRGKCEPILGHMLQGMNVDENPMLQNPAIGKELRIIYDDDQIVVINKPHEFLSVPGKTINDSVYLRIKEKYPKATGPLIIHRLDMSTSGIMVLTKNEEANRIIQSQFINRSVKKRYDALLDGIVPNDEGTIDLPLRVDLNDRPRQLVCDEHGKKAITKYTVLERKDGKTRIHFYPITGRTHQLRVHASHHLGLNCPIIGDDLYGNRAERLHLHAGYLEFDHPITQKRLVFEVSPEF